MSDEDVLRAAVVEVPSEQLSDEALRGVVESFVLREGTDYGTDEVPLARKVEQVLLQLRRGEARILFDPVSESVDIQLAAHRHGLRSNGL